MTIEPTFTRTEARPGRLVWSGPFGDTELDIVYDVKRERQEGG